MTNWYQRFIIDDEPTTPRGFMNDSYFNLISHLFPQDLSDKTVLDLGCNAGFVSFKLAQRGAKVIGFEADENYLFQANFVMNTLGLPYVEFEHTLIENIDFDLYRPDLIVALSVLYHLANPKAIIEKLSSQPCDLVVSFRNALYDDYIKMFISYGRNIEIEASYGRKKAALLKQS